MNHDKQQFDIKKAIEYTNSLGIILQSPEEAMLEIGSDENHERRYHLTRGIAIYVLENDIPIVYFYNEKNSPIIKNASHAISKDRWLVPIRDSSLEHAMFYASIHKNVYTNTPEKIKLDTNESNSNYTDIIRSVLGNSAKTYEKIAKENDQPRLVNLLPKEAYYRIGKNYADVRCIGLDKMNHLLIINAKAEPINSYGTVQDLSTDYTRR